MNYRNVAIALLVLSLLSILLGYFLMYPAITNWCGGMGINCFGDDWTSGVGEPLFWSTWLLPILFFGLIFVRREVFNAWWKVILPISVIALYLIAVSPPLQDFMTPGRTQVTSLMVKFIVIVSLLVIAWKYWRLSRNSKTKPAQRG